MKIDLFFWFFHVFYLLRNTNQTSNLSFKIKALKWHKRLIFKICVSRFLCGIFLFFEKIIPQNKIALKLLHKEKPDLLLCPGSAMDSYSHFFLRSSKKLNIKSSMVISHWDYFTKKGLRFLPNKLLVWGEDMKKQALSVTKANHEDIEIIGSPYFDRIPAFCNNKKIKINKKSDNLKIMFAGTAIPYDELNILNKLDKLITKNNLKITIIYKPHPRAWDRKQSKSTIFKNILFYRKTEVALKDFLIFDGLISPFSSMMIEFALFKKPSLGIFYNDKLNDWPMNDLVNVKHIEPILDQKWFMYCIDEKMLKSTFMKFIKVIKKGDKKIFSNLDKIIYHEKKSTVHDRILKSINDQIYHL